MNQDNNKLNEISRAIGNFEAYASEFRSGSAALTELIKANEKLSCERDAELKKDMHTKFDKEVYDLAVRINDLSARITIIEAARMRAQGVANVGTWFLKNWPIAGLLSMLTGVVVWANGLLS